MNRLHVVFPWALLFLGCAVGALDDQSLEPSSTSDEEILEYARKDWRHWIDADKDCQDTRQEILIRDSLKPVTFKDERECRVASGEWVDPYSSTSITDPSLVDIDHIVALRDAHDSGGYAWSSDEKRLFANDFEQLTVSSRSTNRSKGAKGADQWLPPLAEFRCEYIETWTAVKTRYSLTMSDVEAALVGYMQKTCREGQLPVMPQN